MLSEVVKWEVRLRQRKEGSMSILIKGMAMPKSCEACPFIGLGYDQLVCRLQDCVLCDKAKATCPLIELPPHGRLIDADALLQHQWVSSDWNSGGVHEIVVSITDIDEAPTIIESEGEE